MTMSEIGLLMTGVLIAKRPSVPHNLLKQQPFPMETSLPKYIPPHLNQVVSSHQITPPEFTQTTITTNLSPNTLTLAKANSHYAQAPIKIAQARTQRVSAPSMPILRFGNSGTSVRVLQRLLISKGYAIQVDGAFGPLTETAVKAFQNQRRLAVDGIVGPVTWRELTI
jgi:murein L,D-transpeptidase YcbB/YkuD